MESQIINKKPDQSAKEKMEEALIRHGWTRELDGSWKNLGRCYGLIETAFYIMVTESGRKFFETEVLPISNDILSYHRERGIPMTGQEAIGQAMFFKMTDLQDRIKLLEDKLFV